MVWSGSFFLACVALTGTVTADAAVAADAGFAVAAYLPEWRYEGANWDTISRHTSHLILFSLEVGPDGDLAALDRLPRPELLKEARSAATRHGTHLLICFGGNGRSAGFGPMVRSATARARFLGQLLTLLREHDLDGVDYNWEYPGYVFGTGYADEAGVAADYSGLQVRPRLNSRVGCGSHG